MYTTLDDAIHQIENEAKHETNVEHILDKSKYADHRSPMRQRKQVVFTRFCNNAESTEIFKNFPSVEKMVNLYEMCPSSNNNKNVIKFDERITYNNSPVSDEGCHSSPEDDDLINLNKDKVVRSASSDSALGLDDEQDILIEQPSTTTRRMTLTVNDIPLRSALLPLPEPTTLPICDQNNPLATVRSKTILEANVIEISTQNDERKMSSRRESSQSCLSDNGDDCHRIRYVRTPSVVVSDYSDDTLCGITLEEIEYFRSIRRGSIDERGETEYDISDVSASSSCSNLNYCGSHISILDHSETGGGLRTPERKFSNCSSCSTLSGDEDDAFPIKLAEAIHRQKQKVSQLD